MNKSRRNEIEGSSKDLTAIKDDVTRIRGDELGDFVELNCTMQSYTTRMKSENTISSLTDVIVHINRAIDKLDTIP